MAFAISWDATGTRTYHTGVDRGVLYVSDGDNGWMDGVAWSGLRSVSQSPDGADEQAFYADNMKYLSLRGAENFGGSIGVYDTPPEFDLCDGTRELIDSETYETLLKPGAISFNQQTRRPFCFTYRTLKGNDSQGDEYGYLIHIVYNATASPSSREYQTVNESPSPIELSYDFKTTPLVIRSSELPANIKPTSHVVIDSTKFTTAGRAKLDLIEKHLYGSTEGTGTSAKILLPQQIFNMFING